MASTIPKLSRSHSLHTLQMAVNTLKTKPIGSVFLLEKKYTEKTVKNYYIVKTGDDLYVHREDWAFLNKDGTLTSM